MSNLFHVTPDDIRTSWEKYGNGTPLKEGFAEYLAGQLNQPPPRIPVPYFYEEHCRVNMVCGLGMRFVSPIAGLQIYGV